MKNIVVSVLIFIFISGCSSTFLSVNKDFTFKQGGDTGLVLLSTRMIDNEECYPLLHPKHAMTMIYKQQNAEPGTPLTRLNIRNPIISNDFENPDGFLHIQEAKAGKYEIFAIQYMSGSFGLASFSGYTFEVIPNKVNYLGELTITETVCREKGDSEATIIFSDQSERDEKLLRERVPGVTGNLLHQQVGEGSVITVDK